MSSNDRKTQDNSNIKCHYAVLGVEQSADAATIKKAHRKLALKLHPDKNLDNDETVAEQFRLVQQAYETLSDPMERKWYDDHRDAILRGWSADGSGDSGHADMLFDVVPFTYSGCFRGFGDEDEQGFFAVYRSVFHKIYEGEAQGTRLEGSLSSLEYLSSEFGNSTSSWADVLAFYQGWESFTSGLNFAWADQYDVKEAPNRRVRRAMEEENKKARRTAKRARNDDVLALVRFVKKRDPRVQAKMAQLEVEKEQKEQRRKMEQAERKRQAQQARDDWKVEAEKNMAQREEEDRLAGRFRLADLEEDYDYAGGKKKRGKRKKGKKKKSNFQEDDDSDVQGAATVNSDDQADSVSSASEEEKKAKDEEKGGEDQLEASEKRPQDTDQDLDGGDNVFSEESSSAEEEEPDIWRCECCRKDFKSEAQMENHVKSKKHKEAYKKFQKRMEQQTMDQCMVSL